MTSKEYYRDRYHPQHNLSVANVMLYTFILNNMDIKSIFEFGCNIGRHLTHFQNWGYKVAGCDINQESVDFAIESGLDVKCHDETELVWYHIPGYDLCLTNSVLCHMPEIDKTMRDLKLMSKHMIVVECINKSDNHWYIHDYEKYGFEEQMELSSHVIDGAVYKLYYLCESL